MKSSSPISTHSYAHGHVHHHRNHVHIHGHIHNHDHVLPAVDGVGGDVPGHAPPEACKQILDELDMCGDIPCEELDDCFFDGCEPQALEGLAYPTSARAEGQAGLSTKPVRTEPGPAPGSAIACDSGIRATRAYARRPTPVQHAGSGLPAWNSVRCVPGRSGWARLPMHQKREVTPKWRTTRSCQPKVEMSPVCPK